MIIHFIMKAFPCSVGCTASLKRLTQHVCRSLASKWRIAATAASTSSAICFCFFLVDGFPWIFCAPKLHYRTPVLVSWFLIISSRFFTKWYRFKLVHQAVWIIWSVVRYLSQVGGVVECSNIVVRSWVPKEFASILYKSSIYVDVLKITKHTWHNSRRFPS